MEERVRQLEVIEQILRFFGELNDGEHKLATVLTAPLDCREEEVLAAFDLMIGWQMMEAYCKETADEQKGKPVSSLQNSEIDSEEVLIKFSSYSPRMFLGLVYELKVSAKEVVDLKSSITKQENKWVDFEETINSVKVLQQELGSKLETADRQRDFFEEKIKTLDQELKSKIDNIPERVTGETKENVKKQLDRDGMIGQFFQGIQKDYIQYMAIFIAFFALVNLNLSSTGKTAKDYLIINLSLVASMVTLGSLLEYILNRAVKMRRLLLLVGLALVLWCFVCFVLF